MDACSMNQEMGTGTGLACPPRSREEAWFGGKAGVASLVWARLGNCPVYVEPFAGSLAVLLSRPHRPGIETVNDADGLLTNAWRSIQLCPDEVARHADWPVDECSLHARHTWLLARRDGLTEQLCGDPEWCDPRAAGWWLWGICSWIGSGWCHGKGPWHSVDGRLVNLGSGGVKRQRPHLGDAGQGINRQLPHLGDAGQGEWFDGQAEAWRDHLTVMMRRLSDRLRRVRICCGDWTRVVGPTPTVKRGDCGVFLDPPYDLAARDSRLYAVDAKAHRDIAAEARAWAIRHGSDRRYRIALCGYDLEMPAGWDIVRWKARGGYGSPGDKRGRDNAERECIAFSPGCLGGQLGLFDEESSDG